jgi:purine-binding chemotaxis protein CheW
VHQTSTVKAQYLTFRVAEDDYAVEVLQVHEIIEYSDTVTRVPNAPPAVRGVLNLRGRVVPVVDLAVKFGLDATTPTRRTCVIIVEVRTGDELLVLGLLTDAVDQVIDLARDEIQPPPAFGARVRVEFLDGLGIVADRFVMLLNLQQLLAIEELTAILPERSPLAALEPGSPA